nr:hypothetical protein [Tanacetum cinerariifolium]
MDWEFHLYVSVARFNRDSTKNGSSNIKTQIHKQSSNPSSFSMKAGKSSCSFASILKNGGPVHPTNSSPALVLDDSCLKVIIKGVVYWIRAKELDAWVPKFSNEIDDSSSDEDGSKDDFNDAGNMEPGSKQEGFVDDQNFVTSDIPAHESSNEYVSETHDIQNVVSYDDNGNQVHVKENSALSDPFNIYPILRKKGNIN